MKFNNFLLLVVLTAWFNLSFAAKAPKSKASTTSYTVNQITYYPVKYKKYKATGIASWYGDRFHNKLTASGEIFNKHKMTAAHKFLPIPSIVKVTNLANNKSIKVKVNDRGPFIDNRIIDLSERAAKLLGFREQGLANVRVELISY